MNKQPLLIEIGVEELPVKALPLLSQALFDGITAGLQRRGIGFDQNSAKALSTPRRLAVWLDAVDERQPDQFSEIAGPYLNVALDEHGQPTRALQGFAAKNNVDWTQLERITDKKGERFIYRARYRGSNTTHVLPQVLAEAVKGLPIPKPMRWGAHDDAFVRPVHWLVVMYGSTVVETSVFSVFGIKAGRVTRGHRFMANQPIELSSAADYLPALEQAYVLADPAIRRQRIINQVNEAAEKVGGVARMSEDNLEQVVNLVEWPCAVSCQFERQYLTVPAEALIETMEVNQKFFPILDKDNSLTEHFVGIANIQSKKVADVAKGYERVIRPRFADAKFFFDEDLKQGLADMGHGLAKVTYQTKLGSLADKVQRVRVLAQTMAEKIGADHARITRAATLAKNDLLSRLVNEFPELQGIAGRHYALAAGEEEAVALAIDQAWQPRFAADHIAKEPLGQILAVAERLDTLAGGFAANLKPTGSKDPFSLRRAALGLARTIIEAPLVLNLDELLALACQQFSFVAEVNPADIRQFIIDRLQAYYADQGIPTTHFNAVAQLPLACLHDFDRRLRALNNFSYLPQAAALAAANKRTLNILRKAQANIPSEVNSTLLQEPAEHALFEALHNTRPTTAVQTDYVAQLTQLARLRPLIDAFFEQVMVNSEEAALRENRLALLQQLYRQLSDVAAIEWLSS